MASITIRGLDERVKSGLRLLAARRGVSMEQHARDLLQQAVLGSTCEEPFADRVRRRFAPIAVDALPVPPRRLPRAVPAAAGAPPATNARRR